MAFAVALGIAVTACQTKAPTATPTPTPAPAAAADDWVPVAAYSAADAKVDSRIGELLSAEHIESVADGSKGLTVSVPASSADRARVILLAAVHREHLAATIIDASGAPMP